MKGFLIRVGIDGTSGGWNAPCNNATRHFCYVPMGKDELVEEYDPCYRRCYERAVRQFVPEDAQQLAHWPHRLPRQGHFDPDFLNLTYGEDNERQNASRIYEAFNEGSDNFIVFYASLRPIYGRDEHNDNLNYSIIGFYRVKCALWAENVLPADRYRNAHTRNGEANAPHTTVIVFAYPNGSGRLLQHIRIGNWRNRAYRVFPNLLNAWGGQRLHNDGIRLGIDIKDGFLTRNPGPPEFLNPEGFRQWFQDQNPTLITQDNE